MNIEPSEGMKAVKTHSILSSSNYDDFKSNDEQRTVKKPNVAQIIKSMEEHGFLPSKPVQVYYDGENYVIIDGHHRFVAARTIGLPVLFVVEPIKNKNSIASVNSAVSAWSMLDFVNTYDRRGIEDYRILKRYAEKGFPVKTAAALLATGLSTTSRFEDEKLKAGLFKVETTTSINKILNIIELFSEENKTVKTRNFISCMAMFLRIEGFDFRRMKNRIKSNISMLKSTATLAQMHEQMESIYNRHSSEQDRMNLSFMVRFIK